MVSIITAAFSTEYLDMTWESIKKQDYKDWEYLIVNDGQMDIYEWYGWKCSEREFDKYNVNFIDVYKRLGRYGLCCRNIGVSAMDRRSEYWIWLDDDNMFEEDTYISKMLRITKETGKIAYSNLHLVGKKHGSDYNRYKRTRPYRNQIDCGNPLYKREFLWKYGLLSDHINSVVFDADYIDRIREGEGGEDAFVNVPVNLYFRHKRY